MNELTLPESNDLSLFADSEIKIERSIETLGDYYKINKFSHSRGVAFRQSPRHYIYGLTHFEETPAMTIGRAFHAIVLEEDKFGDMFYGIDISNRPDLAHGMTAKENKAWKSSEDAKHVNKTFLKEAEFDKVRYMKDALFADAFSAELFQEVHTVEYSLFWVDPETGIEIKMKLDAVADDFTLDLKSCVNAKPEVFARHAWDMEYQAQGSLYRNGRPLAKDSKGKPVKLSKGHFYFIACEKEPPYGISVNKASPKFLNAGEDLYMGTLSDFKYWREMGAPDVCYEWRKPLGFSVLNAPYWVK